MCKWSQWWLMAHRSVLHTRADLRSWGSNSAPVLSVSPVIYTWRERGGGDGRGGRIWWVHAAQTTNGRWACVWERETVHRKQEQEKKHVAFEGLTFICGTMSYFAASHRQFFVCAWGFLAHISFRCKWTLPRFCLIKRESRHGRGTVCLSSHTDIFAHLWACSKVAI